MAIRTLLLLLLSVALGSCASRPTWTSAQGSAKLAAGASPLRYAWDGLGQNPNLPRSHRVPRKSSTREQDSNLQREAVLAELRPYSAAWWVVHDEIEADREAKIARKLVICRGCISSESRVGMTASIGGR